MCDEVKTQIFLEYEFQCNFRVYRKYPNNPKMEHIGLIYHGTDNKMHFHAYRTNGNPIEYRTHEMHVITGLMEGIEKVMKG